MAQSTNFIKQVNVGGSLYDIAPYRKITFTETGKSDVVYDGVSDITVAIPTVSDLLQNPLQFIGTIASNGTLTFVSGTDTNYKPGYLAYFTEDCPKFVTNIAGESAQACEAGDMAICVGVSAGTPQWKVVTGENQVKVANPDKTVNLTTTGKNVLDVEGKNLNLGINPAKSKVQSNGTVTVPTKTIYLKKGSKSNAATTTNVSQATSVENSGVTISSANLKNALANTSVFSFNAGALPTLSKVATPTSLTITSTSAAGYVSQIGSSTLVSGVTLTSENTAGISVLTGITTKAGIDFVTGIKNVSSEAGAKFTIETSPTLSANVATSWGTESGTKGEGVVSSVAFASTSNPITGLSTDGTDVVTGVTTGSGSFVTGLNTDLSTSYDVATSVVYTSGKLNKTSKALASVTDNVLVIDPSNFLTDSTTYTSGSIKVQGKKFTTGNAITSVTPTKKGFVRTGLSISYKSLNFTNPTINTTKTYYGVDVAHDTIYDTATSTSLSLNVKTAGVTNGTTKFLTGVSVVIPANTIVSTTFASDGKLPTFTINSSSITDLAGNLDSTALSFGAQKTIYGFGSATYNTDTYELTTTVAAGDSKSSVTVGSEGTLNITVTTTDSVVTGLKA